MSDRESNVPEHDFIIPEPEQVSNVDPPTPPGEAVPVAVEDESVATHARQISRIVEGERLRRRRTLRLWAALLLPPVALGVAALLAPQPRAQPNFNSPEFTNSVEPILRDTVGERIGPVVEEKLGPSVDGLIESKVSGKIQGASPARVEELSEEVKQVSNGMTQAQAGVRELQSLKGDLSAVRAGLSDVQALKTELPQLRESVNASDGRVKALQQRVDTISNNRDDGEMAAVIKRLEDRLGEIDAKLDRSVKGFTAQFSDTSKSIRSLSEKADRLERELRERPDRNRDRELKEKPGRDNR